MYSQTKTESTAIKKSIESENAVIKMWLFESQKLHKLSKLPISKPKGKKSIKIQYYRERTAAHIVKMKCSSAIHHNSINRLGKEGSSKSLCINKLWDLTTKEK